MYKIVRLHPAIALKQQCPKPMSSSPEYLFRIDRMSSARLRYWKPSLTNEILPLFKCRWASGPQPSFDDPWHQDIMPALQIDSFLLTEDYPLLWFSRLTFAERRTKPGYPPRYYLKSSMYAESPETLQKIKANIVQLGPVITLVWVPRGYDPMNKMSHGAPTRTSVTCHGIGIFDVQTGLQSKKMDACMHAL